MLRFRFDFNTSVQAAAQLIRLHGGRVDRLRLLSLLYTVDRELLIKTGLTLTGDFAVSFSHGPLPHTLWILSSELNHSALQDGWRRFVTNTDGELSLNEDPGTGNLTKRMRGKLQEVYDRYRMLETKSVLDAACEYPEWRSEWDGGTVEIPWELVLEVGGEGTSTLAYQHRNQEYYQADDVLLEREEHIKGLSHYSE